MSLLPCLLAVLLRPASADVVDLRNGVSMKGIVAGVTDEGVQVQVDESGYVFLDTAVVVGVRLQTPRQNDGLLAQWRGRRLALEAREREQRRFEEAQRAKGLTLLDGEWLTAQEFERRLQVKKLQAEWAAKAFDQNLQMRKLELERSRQALLQERAVAAQWLVMPVFCPRAAWPHRGFSRRGQRFGRARR